MFGKTLNDQSSRDAFAEDKLAASIVGCFLVMKMTSQNHRKLTTTKRIKNFYLLRKKSKRAMMPVEIGAHRLRK